MKAPHFSSAVQTVNPSTISRSGLRGQGDRLFSLVFIFDRRAVRMRLCLAPLPNISKRGRNEVASGNASIHVRCTAIDGRGTPAPHGARQHRTDTAAATGKASAK